MSLRFRKSQLLLSFVILKILFLGSFAQLNFPANQIPMTEGMNFYYEFFEQEQKVRMGLEINQNVNYFAVGFSSEDNSNDMRNHDIAAFVFEPSAAAPNGFVVDIQDMFAERNGRPTIDASQDYTLLDSYIVDEVRQVLFERIYDTQDPNDYTFNSDQDGQVISIIWAFNPAGGAEVSYHGRVNRGGVEMALTYASMVEEEVVLEEEAAPAAEEGPVLVPEEEEVVVVVPPEEEQIPEEVVVVEEEEVVIEEEPNVELVESSVPLTFPSSQLSIPEGGLTFYYEFIEATKTVRMGLEISRDVDYFAIGFAPENRFGMDGFDIAAFIFVPSSSNPGKYFVRVQDLYATENAHPPSDTSLGGTDDYKLVKYYATADKRQVLFERPYNTGDKNDYTFTPDQNTTKTAVSWAWNKYNMPILEYHDLNRGTIVTQLYTGVIGEAPTEIPEVGEPPAFDTEVVDSPNALALPPSQISIPDGGMTLYFEFIEKTKTIRMGLEMDADVQYFSVGFADEGNSGMVNFDMVAFMFVPSGTGSFNVAVLDLYATQNAHPPTDESKGGTSDYKLIEFHASIGKRQVLFERAFDTGDIWDYKFHPEDSQRNIAVSWAWGGTTRNDLQYHGRQNRGTILTQMYNGFKGSGKKYTTGIDSDLFYKYHGYLLLFLWGFLIDVAIWIARYRKSSKFYVGIHLVLTSFIYVATVVLTAIALKLRSEGVEGSLIKSHFALGIIILVFSTVQVLLGFIFRSKIVSLKTTTKIPTLSKIHLYLGVATYIIAKTQLLVGLKIFQPDYIGILGGWYGALLICWIGHGYINKYWDYTARKNVKVQPVDGYSKFDEHQKLMDLLNNNTPVSEILESPDVRSIKWAILDNQVFELKDFTHPGGNFIINQIHGREVGRFIYGVAGLESFVGESQHIHSKQALAVVRKNFIGTINNSHQVFVPLIMPEAEKQLAKSLTSQFNWTLLKKTNLSEHTTKFEFKCDLFEIDPWDKDIRHLGRHIRISHIAHPKTRLYTLVLSMTEARSYRRALLAKKSEKSAQIADNLKKIAHLKTIPLIIKKYEFPKANTFSSFIHNSPENTGGFLLEGPYGTGFGLTPESTGLHCIFAAGTGVLPFLDLFDYLLTSLLENDGENNILKNGFKLHIFACFGHINDFVGLDICEKLVQASHEKGFKDAIKITIRAKEAKESRFYTITEEVFDHDFMIRNFESESKKVYICGPPMFNQKIPLALGLVGLSKEKIMLV